MAESHLPAVNGVTISFVRTTAELRPRGHQVIIFAAGKGNFSIPEEAAWCGPQAFGLPMYREVRVGLAREIGSIERLSLAS